MRRFFTPICLGLLAASCLAETPSGAETTDLAKGAQRGIDVTAICERPTSSEGMSEDEIEEALGRISLCSELKTSLEKTTGLRLFVDKRGDGKHIMTYSPDPCDVNCNVGSSELARDYLKKLMNGVYIEGKACGWLWPTSCNVPIEVDYDAAASAVWRNGLGMAISETQLAAISDIVTYGEVYEAAREGEKFRLKTKTSFTATQVDRFLSTGMVFLHETMLLLVGKQAIGNSQQWHDDPHSERDQILQKTGEFQCEAEAGIRFLRHKADYEPSEILTNPAGHDGKRVMLLARCDQNTPIAVLYDADTYSHELGDI